MRKSTEDFLKVCAFLFDSLPLRFFLPRLFGEIGANSPVSSSTPATELGERAEGGRKLSSSPSATSIDRSSSDELSSSSSEL